MTETSPFQNFSAADCGDQLAEKLRRLLEPFCFDGTECHSVINAELRGPENEVAASNIRHVNVSQYQDTAPIDVVIEVVGKWLEDEGPFSESGERADGIPANPIHDARE
jgi:hypothetical protein